MYWRILKTDIVYMGGGGVVFPGHKLLIGGVMAYFQGRKTMLLRWGEAYFQGRKTMLLRQGEGVFPGQKDNVIEVG